MKPIIPIIFVSVLIFSCTRNTAVPDDDARRQIPFGTETMDDIEKGLISKYRPLVNIQHNPSASEALIAARNKCVDYTRS